LAQLSTFQLKFKRSRKNFIF